MERVIRLLCNQLMSFGTHKYVGRFDADDQIVISHVLDDFHFVKGALHDALCGNAVIFLHQVLFQRTAVDTHTDRDISLFCRIHNCFDALIASDISRIDTDLVRTIFHGCNGHLIIKMNVRYQRNGDLLLDLL